MASLDPPASASWVTGIIGVCYYVCFLGQTYGWPFHMVPSWGAQHLSSTYHHSWALVRHSGCHLHSLCVGSRFTVSPLFFPLPLGLSVMPQAGLKNRSYSLMTPSLCPLNTYCKGLQCDSLVSFTGEMNHDTLYSKKLLSPLKLDREGPLDTLSNYMQNATKWVQQWEQSREEQVPSLPRCP